MHGREKILVEISVHTKPVVPRIAIVSALVTILYWYLALVFIKTSPNVNLQSSMTS